MPSGGSFARIGLIAAVSMVVGISTLGSLLKQAPPDEVVRVVALPASARPEPVAAAKTAEPVVDVPVKPAVASLTLEEPAPAAPKPTSDGISTAAAPLPAAVSAPASPTIQPLTDESSATAALAALPVASQPPRGQVAKPAKRAGYNRPARQRQVRPAPFGFGEFIASHAGQ
jgi:hypothetical protein